jgi:PEGA domain
MLTFFAFSKTNFKLFSMISILSISHLVFGCAFVTGRYQNVPITTNVPGAKIFIDGQPVGISQREGIPLVANLEKSKEHYVTAAKDGYESTTRSLHATLSDIGILDVIGTAIF